VCVSCHVCVPVCLFNCHCLGAIHTVRGAALACAAANASLLLLTPNVKGSMHSPTPLTPLHAANSCSSPMARTHHICTRVDFDGSTPKFHVFTQILTSKH